MFGKIIEVVIGAYQFSPLGVVVLTGVFFVIIIDCIKMLKNLRTS